MEIITSKSNSKVKLAASLNEKKYRLENGMFLIEGRKILDMGLEANFWYIAVSAGYVVVSRIIASAHVVAHYIESKTFLCIKEQIGALSCQCFIIAYTVGPPAETGAPSLPTSAVGLDGIVH